MIQQVNLYTEELRPRKEKLQAGTALGIVICGLMAVALVAGVFAYQNAGLATEVASLERQNERLDRAVANLSSALDARQPDSDVEEALARASETLARRQRLLKRVESLVLSENGRFSAQMAALARQIPEDVWLTGVVLESGADKVTIEGRSRSGALVPHYLEKLGEEAAFAGKTFGVFRLSRPEGGRWVDFYIASERQGEDG